MKKGQVSSLTSYRLEKLERIGFVWHNRTLLNPADSGVFSDADGKDQMKPNSNEGGMGVKPESHVDKVDV